jgi:protein arginine kinase activator
VICENCKQRPAKVTVTQVHNGEHFERHYCENCANSLHPFYVEYKQDPLSLHQLLSNWFNHAEQQPIHQKQDRPKLVCDECGWSIQRFLDEGKFGCASCYNSFRNQLPNVLKRLHNGNITHIGKAPGALGEKLELKKRIEAIRLQMKDAIETERFEEAAMLRDEARELESRIASGGDEKHVD